MTVTTHPTDPLIGQTFEDRYTILSRIARGGMAMVYLADDIRLHRKVAVKVMHQHLSEDENFTKRFDREARSAAQLSHPNLVNVFDQGQDLGRSYLIMEYLPSITLRDLLKSRKSLTLDETLEISEAVLAGLAAAHEASIVHRDVKPENVMLVDDGRIKIGDFGLAREVSANTTTGQALLGTIAYLSPELVTRGIADARSDLYAFGIMLYEMLVGAQPFTGDQPMQIAYQHAHSTVPRPSEASATSTPAIDDFVTWLTRRTPEERPTDAGVALEVLRDLRADPYRTPDTLVLHELPEADNPTPATTVLDPVAAAPIAGVTPVNVDSHADFVPPPAAPMPPVAVAQQSADRRRRRGRTIALVSAGAIVLAGGLGFWFGQGPGSRVVIPSFVGETPAAAEQLLADRDLLMKTAECSSLDVPVGNVVSTHPTSGTRVDRESTVEVCLSSGPEQLPVPSVVGLTAEKAETAIVDARFTYGEVVDTRFDEAAAGTVLAALNEAQEVVGETLPEQSVINLVVSAGPLPNVVGMDEGDAIDALEGAGLVHDDSDDYEAYDPTMKEGRVLSVRMSADPVRPGDSFSITLSLGPELFEIPDVEGDSVNEAVKTLREAGFEVDTGVIPEGLAGDLVEVKGTKPKAGSEHPAGTKVALKYI
nr:MULTISPECIES: Stk1 family PASTA domain-containing Ser/Thr kinase [unclassified Leucobacter]